MRIRNGMLETDLAWMHILTDADIENIKRKNIINNFECIDDLVKHIEKASTNRTIFEDTSSMQEKEYGFNDCKDLGEAMNRLKYGTDIYFDNFNKFLLESEKYIKENIVLNKSSYINDIVGFAPIVPNAILGNPINMINTINKQKKIPVVTIIVERAVSAFNRATTISNFAAIILSLIQVMELKGIRCQIYVSSLFEEGDERYGFKVKLKKYLQPLNIYKLQFPIISSDMFRRVGFRLLETCPYLENENWYYDGYGHPYSTYHEVLNSKGEPSEELQAILRIKANDIFIPNHNYFNYNSGQEISDVVEKIIEETNFKNYIKLRQ